MRKLMLGVFALAALLLVRNAGSDAVVAQGKKGAVGVIEIGEGKDGKFRFFVRNDEGKLLAMSGPGGYATAKDAGEAIEELKEVVAKAKVTMLKKKAKQKASDR